MAAVASLLGALLQVGVRFFSCPCWLTQNKLCKQIIAGYHYEISFYSLLGTDLKQPVAQPLL